MFRLPFLCDDQEPRAGEGPDRGPGGGEGGQGGEEDEGGSHGDLVQSQRIRSGEATF